MFDAPTGGRLTAAMQRAFEAAGVMVLRGFVEEGACAALRRRALDLVTEKAPTAPASRFSTTSNVQLSDDDFVRSGAAISFFFEEEADGAGPSQLNKMGHAMHDLDPVFDAFSRTKEIAAVAAGLGFADPLLVQSMYIFKPPQIGGQVVCHQDSTYLYTEPETCVGFWFAIDDADAQNGAMAFIPGAHRGPLRAVNRRGADGALHTETLVDAPFDGAPALIPARTGDLVIFHGRSPHMSAANRSDRPRHAYALHVVERSARWPATNWLQRPASLPFRGFS